ncbi:amidohydrolase [Trueperella pecoris]|uniref:Amidohydrolase n=1 Tax=Trueperella pecoris TaxID=2733571 RepID=A0A7M1R2L5_9ACTO|nr:amidohydrolase [Trueperella pecoris]QOR48346.1 amidohydrolase [Trueperella pecoris]
MTTAITADIARRINDAVADMNDELVTWRRDFHRHPELGFQEYRTTSMILQKLTDWGYEVLYGPDVCEADARMGLPSKEEDDFAFQRALDEGADPAWLEKIKGQFTGAVAIMKNGEGPTVGMRFDIDGLPIHEADDDDYEPAAEGFRSQHDHTMHACGHDAHITIGLGTAKLLAEMKDAWSGTLKLIFQPAEEGVRGGKSIVAKGHCDDVDFMLAQHVDEKSQDGDICAGAGGALATSKMDVNFFGRSAHASGAPEEGRNVVPAVATAILNLYAISRHSHGPSRINVGKVIIDGGRNIIADKAHLEIEVRGETTEINDYMEKRARTVIAAAADMYEVEHEIIRMGESISLDSDRDLMARIDAVATDLGLTPRDPNWMMASGSEDYAFMMDRVQSNGGKATFIRMLTSSPAGAHNRKFCVQEKVLPAGVRLFTGAAIDLMPRG